MKYNILLKYSNNKDLWQYHKVTTSDSSSTTTSIYETEDMDELEQTLLELYKTRPTDEVKVVSDVSATLDIVFE